MNDTECYETPVLQDLGDFLELTGATGMGNFEDGAMKTVSAPPRP